MDGHGGGYCHQEQFRHSLRKKEEGMEETNTQRRTGLKDEIRVGGCQIRKWAGYGAKLADNFRCHCLDATQREWVSRRNECKMRQFSHVKNTTNNKNVDKRESPDAK